MLHTAEMKAWSRGYVRARSVSWCSLASSFGTPSLAGTGLSQDFASAELRLGNAHRRHRHRHHCQPQHNYDGDSACQIIHRSLGTDLCSSVLVQPGPPGSTYDAILAGQSRGAGSTYASPL